MITEKSVLLPATTLVGAIVISDCSLAHDPVFGLGAHTLFKDGIELHWGNHGKKSSDGFETEGEFQFKYGLTSDWVVGVSVPYEYGGNESTGRGPIHVSTKYRFWRQDRLKEQESISLMVKVVLDGALTPGDVTRDNNDYLLGIAYGYEGWKWYRWVSIRHRINADAVTGLARPNVWRVDLAAGVRLTPAQYHAADWVWILELNGEAIEHISQGVGNTEKYLGGNQWFLSPGMMWTYRNFALKAGVQWAIADELLNAQEQDAYRVKVELEWHL